MDMKTILEAKWYQLEGTVRQKFGELTHNDMAEINGRIEALLGKLQERYDVSLEEAEQMLTRLNVDADGNVDSLKLDAEAPDQPS
ncbi:MAG: hypothetical protein KDI44_16890 [Thiothrix sp.]|nr:hypothetical protein [Thiothrix sp.]HPQ97554.1 hypothetical protein [Thiolinea sp.]